jgi:lysophospholipase L1-like esterase
MKTSNLLRIAAALAVALLLALPATAQAQQADFTTFVAIGDSLTAGFTDGCLVDYAQGDSWGAIIARAAGATYQQPIIAKPGLGPCMYLISLAPSFGNRPNTGVPTNSTLARPYNNLSVPGFTIHDAVATNPATAAGGLAYIVLRGLGTELQQAASLKPTFLLLAIGHNDVLGPASSGTVIEGVTMAPMASINADLDLIFSTMKAAQGGTGKGLVFNIGDVGTIPFFSTVSPILGVYPAGTPGGLAGQPIYALYDSCGGLAPACPVPAGSLLTLLAAGYLQAGYGIPCAILAPTDPKQANCNKPLHDNIWVDGTGTLQAGVVLTQTEIAALRVRTGQINNALITKGTAAGYKIWDEAAYFADIKANGRNYGAMSAPIGTAFLSGGFFGYDGIHPTSIGYAMVADDLIQTINYYWGNNLPRVNMQTFLANGDTYPGGYPNGSLLGPGNEIDWAAAIFGPDTWHDRLRYVFPDMSRKSRGIKPLEGMPISNEPGSPASGREQVN